MRQIANLVFCALLTGLGATARGAEDPVHPAVFVDEGACPGEGCTYDQWKVEKATELHALPDKSSKVVATCRPGTEVVALTGQVRTVAGEFTVKRKHGAFVPGDVLWVYTYLGEGTFRVWFAGRLTEQDLNFSPWGGSGGTRCEEGPRCWGELKNEMDMEWWVRLRMADGVTGWSLEAEDYRTGDE